MAKTSNLKFQLRGTLIVWWSSVSISNDLEQDQSVEFTDETVILYNIDKTIVERVRASATGGTLTLLKRGMENDSETEYVALEKERREGSYGAMTVFAPQIVDKTADNILTWDNEFTGDVTMSGSFRDPVYDDDTERDTAITSPVNGMRIYNTAEWLFQKYQWWAWTDDTSWWATPNASETVAGKVEIATSVEFTAWTDTGGTWASLVAVPSLIKAKNDTQDSSISTNAWNISTNSTNIGTNTSNIAANTNAIATPWTAAWVSWNFPNPWSVTVTIPMWWVFNTVEFGIAVSQDYASNNYHWILLYWKFVCWASWIEVVYTSLSTPNWAWSNYDLWDGTIVGTNMNSVWRTTSTISVTTAWDVLSIEQVYKDWTDLKIALSATWWGTFTNCPYDITPITIIN